MASLTLSKSYSSIIQENFVTGEVLTTMTKEDWNALGVKVFGDVRVLTKAVSNLQ